MKAITKRREVPEAVTEEIVDRGGEAVLISLAKNQGAQIKPTTMEKMIEQSHNIHGLQKPMMERFDLPPQLLTQMYFFVSSALKKEILKRSDMLDSSLIDEAVNSNRKRILGGAMRSVKAEIGEAHQFIQEKIRANAVNESLLKELIDMRRSTEFLLAFSHYLGVNSSTAQALLKDKTWESLAIACRAAGLERRPSRKLFSACRKVMTNKIKRSGFLISI